jgi:ABC-2 type transport system ATP-binding protein
MMLRLSNFTKTYHTAPVLQIKNPHLPSGFCWLKGENGTGKTTLLKSVAGLLPFDGKIVVNDISLRKQRMLYAKAVSLPRPIRPFRCF